jgi:hypothetical protein
VDPGGGLAALRKIIVCFCGDSNRDTSSSPAHSPVTISAELFRRSGNNGVFGRYLVRISARSYTTLTVVLRALSQFWNIISVRPRLLSVKSSLVHE